MSETKRVRADDLKPGDVCKDGTVKSVEEINSHLMRITFLDGNIKNIASDWTVDVLMPDARDALRAENETVYEISYQRAVLHAENTTLRMENAALRNELAACHKVIIDAQTITTDILEPTAPFDFVRLGLITLDSILDSAPEPSDETLRLIEDTGGDDAQR